MRAAGRVDVDIVIAEPREVRVQSEPVCDLCGHGQGLHAEAADVECIVCIERGDEHDCPSFSTLTVWR